MRQFDEVRIPKRTIVQADLTLLAIRHSRSDEMAQSLPSSDDATKVDD
jgi:hypothetical protein